MPAALHPAVSLIVEKLGRPLTYAVQLVDQLTEREAAQIVSEAKQPGAAVAVAAIVYAARIRAAKEEARENHEHICATVDLPDAPTITPAKITPEPGIRILDDPRPDPRSL